jgi:hypothetical protein
VPAAEVDKQLDLLDPNVFEVFCRIDTKAAVW